MQNAFSYLVPKIENLTVSPKMIQLFIPPIKWHGDPKGHVGTYDTFFYISSGECSLMIEDSSTILRAGDLAFLPKGKMRAYTSMSDEISLYEINFEAEINERSWFEGIEHDDEIYVVKPQNPEQVKKMFEDSARYEFEKDLMYDVFFCSNIVNLMCIFLKEKNRLENYELPFKAVTKYMRENLGRTIKISELSSISYMEETYFIKKFKKAFGDSPIAYLNKLRIYQAMTYLAENKLSLTDIARMVGIYDNSYFSKIFKLHCGITPTEYRNIFIRQSKIT